MNDEEKRLYNIQKAKYESSMRQVKKMHISPVDRRFDLTEAEKLLNGQFHEEEDEMEEVEMNARFKNSTLYMSREESFIGHKLESFENALTKIITKSRFD